MCRRQIITMEDYRRGVQIRQDGLLNIYLADSAILLDWRKFHDRHFEDENVHWKPPFIECIFQNQETMVRVTKQEGETRGAIPLSPILTEVIRIAIGRVPSILEDLFQMKTLVVEPRGRLGWSDHYLNFSLWQSKYIFVRMHVISLQTCIISVPNFIAVLVTGLLLDE